MAIIEHKESEQNLHSLRAKVFYHLQNNILNGVYKTGELLTESRLCEELGVSRTPIREAIRQLELEGLVHSVPNKGVFVNGISFKDIEDIYTIRMLIEGLAARWAAENITDEESAELKEALDLEEFYTAKNDSENLLKLDSKFHDTIFRASKSRPLMHVLSMFHHYVQKPRIASLESPDRAKRVLEEHKAIYGAIAEKNSEMAEKLTVEHVRNASVECQTAYKQLMNREEN